MVVLHQCARVKEIVRHLGTVLPLFDNSLGHRAGNLREKPTDLFNRGYVFPVQLASAIPNGLVIDEILRYGFLFAARPGLILLLVAAHRLLQVLELRFLTSPDQIAARYSLGCDCRSCLASTFRPVGVSIFSASSFSS